MSMMPQVPVINTSQVPGSPVTVEYDPANPRNSKEVVTGYFMDPSRGAVVIPSAAGDHGKQMTGFDPDQPQLMLIDPHLAFDGQARMVMSRPQTQAPQPVPQQQVFMPSQPQPAYPQQPQQAYPQQAYPQYPPNTAMATGYMGVPQVSQGPPGALPPSVTQAPNVQMTGVVPVTQLQQPQGSHQVTPVQDGLPTPFEQQFGQLQHQPQYPQQPAMAPQPQPWPAMAAPAWTPPQQQQQSQLRQMLGTGPMPQAQPMPQPGGSVPPRVQVTYHMEDMQIPVMYHEAILNGPNAEHSQRLAVFIVGWDLRCQGFPPPPAFSINSPDRPFRIRFKNFALVAHFDGITFESQGREYVVFRLDMDQSRELNNDQGQPSNGR